MINTTKTQCFKQDNHLGDFTNDQRFIDINIDSDNEECSSSSASPSSPKSNNVATATTTRATNDLLSENNKSKFLFNFSNKTKGLNQSPIKSNEINKQVNSSSDSNKVAKTSNLILQNLNEISLNDEFEYSDDDEDEEDDAFNDHIKNNQSGISFNHESFLNNLLSSTQQTFDDSKLDSDHSSNNSMPTTPSSTNKNSGLVSNELKIHTKQKNLNDYVNSELTKSIVSSTSSINSKSETIKSNKKCSNLNTASLRNDSLVDGLLGDIYDRFNISFKESFDSDVFTDLTVSSSRLSGCDSQGEHESESRHYSQHYKLAKNTLQTLSQNELKNLVNEMSTKVNQISLKLVKQLKQKDKQTANLNRNCDLLTAMLQARSLKRRVDTQMKFTFNPMPGEAGFIQWKTAMKALTRLPGGVPKEFRKSIWLNLSKNYIKELNLDWNKVRRVVFNERSNPDDDELGIQIVKDLHRTGCSAFSGHENEQDRALLKRVLLAYARYNKSVGYCQGFNIIAALILEIVDKKEDDALICMIYLIDHILPEGYFTNSMHTLAIDMAVFRELLKAKLPKLWAHLNELQYGGNFTTKNINNNKQMSSTYEPPLTNVFTMQWFLTLFATCLPKNVLLRVWDCLFLEGAEILFRTSISIWDKLSISIMKANSADAFYSMMSVLSIKLFDPNVINENDLINKIYSYGEFPLEGLQELREKFTFNITPFLQSKSKANCNSNASEEKLVDIDGSKKPSDSLQLRKLNINNGEEENDDEVEDLAKMISCFALLMPNRPSITSSSRNDIVMSAAAMASTFAQSNQSKSSSSSSQHSSSLFNLFKSKSSNSNAKSDLNNNKSQTKTSDISMVTPGAFSFISQMHNPKPLSEHLTLDINELKKQYKKLKERQRQAHIIIQTASSKYRNNNNNSSNITSINGGNKNYIGAVGGSSTTTSIASPLELEKAPIVNHLLIKPNDLQKNTLKKSIRLSMSIQETIDVEKINQNYNIIDKILSEKPKKKKTPKPYYSDDESDDSDEEENQDATINSNLNNNIEDIEENAFSNSTITNQTESDSNTLSLDPQSSTLTDLANESNEHDCNNNNMAKHLMSSNSSLSSIVSVNTKIESLDAIENKQISSNLTETNLKFDSRNEFVEPVIQTTTESVTKFEIAKPIKSYNTKKQLTNSIINQLINEEKKNMMPVNPFPVRHINSSVAKNGIRLGLYK